MREPLSDRTFKLLSLGVRDNLAKIECPRQERRYHWLRILTLELLTTLLI